MLLTIPKQFAHLKVWNGIPVPYVTYMGPEKPEFLKNDANRWAYCLEKRLCAYCALPLKYWIYFIGTQEQANEQLFTDPPMHKDCAWFFLKMLCALSKANYELKEIKAVLYMTRQYKLVKLERLINADKKTIYYVKPAPAKEQTTISTRDIYAELESR
jgi:hypothetical protein